MSAFTLPRAFWKSRESKEKVIQTQHFSESGDSKLQKILGITDAELKSARSRSLSSGSIKRLHSVSFSEATTAPNSSRQATGESQKVGEPYLHEIPPSSVLANEISDSVTPLPKLRSFTSSSTLRSRYDSQGTRASATQQTSDLSVRDFAIRRGTPSILTTCSQEIDHPRQLRFFTPQQSRRNESRQSGRVSSNSEDKLAQVSPSLSVKSSPVWTQTVQSSLPATASAPASPSPMTPIKRFFSHRKTTGSQPVQQVAIRYDGTTPVTKIHVRKPKAGTRHWFDGLEGDSSDDEDSSKKEPLSEQSFFDDVERALEEVTNKQGSTTVSEAPKGLHSSQTRTYSDTASSVPCRVINPSGSDPLELPTTELTSESGEKDNVSKMNTGPGKADPSSMAGINLNQQSVLSLSSSEDEDDKNELSSVTSRSTKLEPIIRESVMAETIADSEVEVGLAHAVKTTPVETPPRSITPRAERTGRVSYSAFPIPSRTQGNIKTSRLVRVPSKKDEMTESDIITAFSATPSETGSKRTSFRTSDAFSDNASMKSTRMMQVTRQEQQLLTAMRSKKAAMRDATKAADRQCALKVLESGVEHVPIDDQHSLDMRLGNRYAPQRGPAHRRSLSGGATVNTRASGTTFQTSTDSYSRRGSQATFRSEFSDDLQLPYSSYRDSGHKTTLPSTLRPFYEDRLGGSRVRDTFLSAASDSSIQRRSSHIVLLDELDESLERESIPSQLFMETPFIGWDRMNVTVAH